MSNEHDGPWLSAADLAEYGKRAGLPGSARGCTKKAQRENWPAKQVRGKGGKGGLKTLYRPPATVLAAIDALGAPVAPKSAPTPAARRGGPPPADYVAIPLYDGARADDDALMFRDSWIRAELGMQPRDLCLIRVAGDSMEPTLRSGDAILVDRRAARPDRDGIYILRMHGMLLVKRLQALPGAKLRVISDNPAFASFEVALDELDGGALAVIGRVVWIGRRM